MPSKAALRAIAASEEKSRLKALTEDEKAPLLEKASAKAQTEIATTTIWDDKIIKLISRFEEKEVGIGKKLGEGGFCTVFEIASLKLSSQAASAAEEEHLTDIEEYHTRSHMSAACIRKNEARYAIKRLSDKSLADPHLYEKGVADLATEAGFLAVLKHPNIIKVRGYALGDFCADRFFIVMDRLYDTLEIAIRKWRDMEKKNTSFLAKNGEEKSKKLFTERIEFAFDLAGAMDHLHNLNVIYRDLKPENVGFDVRGDVKIFDFGLAKEVRNPDESGNYNLTGYCGSPMYMAPEVMKGVPYNLKADVYSFSIMLWEMTSLSTPYKKLPINVMEKMVSEKNYRPDCDKKWPEAVTKIITECWDPIASKRPSFDKIKTSLFSCVMALDGDENLGTSLDKSSRSFTKFREAAK